MTQTDTRSPLRSIDWELVAVHVVLLSVASFMFWASADLSEVARRAPMLILFTMILLILGDLSVSVYRAVTGKNEDDLNTDRIDAPLSYQFAHLGGFVACGLLIYNLGYRLATPIFLTVFLLVMRVRPKVLVPLVAGVWLFVYVIFSEILNVR